ncbi:ankyrin repeat and zinc finger domain-containing protein 1 isoform X1 [Pangasianodon hypophthalmus]|uniref:ankyrin repeat and zinc finger domain-containing protein 1 isoform X1 n=1 Tax=Pangasianodon hypophthalmus TaxID=310915 RepID=UPI00230821FE|nr:ankyrin repeat and zinc finger domain-containing protein 1 isoform X1 [Pangasianodon hypophthalmus]XP_026766806.3 ankyrin repeat and zinc finger domain-containing protein 1 isoform X1 [Pangasianodon hypophthalmus]
MMARPDRCSLFDLVVDLKLIDGLREISELQNHQETLHLTIREEFPDDKRGIDGRRDEPVAPGEVSDRKFCSACQCSFESREEQMEHYKLDWHRFNLRQRLAGRSPVTVEEFEKKTGMGDVSSISGSDSEDDESHGEDESDGADGVISYGGRLSTRVLLQNSQGQYLCLYRCAVQKRTNDSEANLVDSLLNVSEKTVWVILMTGGGHFAGAVYKGKEVLQHKTFHRYTVRAKRGTAQSVRDTQNRGHAPKSAGAALRRYNEAALTKDIQELLKNWAEYLTQADAIFLRTPKYNRSVFFGGRGAPLEKKDSRIRSIPFATRRATFSEITRVHDVLSTLQIYDKTTDVCSILSSSKRTWQKKTSNQTNQNAAVAHQVDHQEEEEEEEEEEVSVQLQIEEVTLTTLDLREHELKPSKKKRRKRKERKPEATEKEGKAMQREDFGSRELKDETGNVKMGEEITEGKKNLKNNKRDEEDEACALWEFSVRDALYTACKTGDTEALHTLLKQDEHASIRLLNTPIDSAGYTLLHVASAAAQKHAVQLLLEMGSDPTCRDRKGQTPYAVAPDKESRNMFRKFMAEHPNKYDYAKAQVPGPLTAEIESKKAEKKKAQKAAKKQREKEQREEKRREEEEQEEKRRFLALSDREKRALAAERRLAEQVATAGGTLTNIRRCWQCGESLLGKVPFEYLNYSFCSTRCVQTHRKSNTAAKP